MNKGIIVLAVVAALLGYQKWQHRDAAPMALPASDTAVQTVTVEHSPVLEAGSSRTDTEQMLQRAFERQQSNIQVAGEGVVLKTLPDDNKGSRHQRFILKLSSGQTLLVAHNIDLADKIRGLKKGDTVGFYGEYEWSQQGGVIHWTHHDPQGRHADGWLKHQGRIYQ